MDDFVVYFMRDNHTFIKMNPNDVESSLSVLKSDDRYYADGWKYGMLSTHDERVRNKALHAGKVWSEFEREARQWFKNALSDIESKCQTQS